FESLQLAMVFRREPPSGAPGDVPKCLEQRSVERGRGTRGEQLSRWHGPFADLAVLVEGQEVALFRDAVPVDALGGLHGGGRLPARAGKEYQARGRAGPDVHRDDGSPVRAETNGWDKGSIWVEQGELLALVCVPDGDPAAVHRGKGFA